MKNFTWLTNRQLEQSAKVLREKCNSINYNSDEVLKETLELMIEMCKRLVVQGDGK